MNKILKGLALSVFAVAVLAGCGDPPIAERVENRDECEAAGGRYWEVSDLGHHWGCDLDSDG